MISWVFFGGGFGFELGVVGGCFSDMHLGVCVWGGGVGIYMIVKGFIL